jgi:acyl-CoA synthetase (AMP-forming)/AMP-acid ligase II
MLGIMTAIDPSPAPILDLLEGYRGHITDLERGDTVDGDGLRRRRDQFAAYLKSAGICAGERIVFAVANGPSFPAALAAVLSVGAAPILTHATTTGSELLRTARAWHATWLLTDGEAGLRDAVVWQLHGAPGALRLGRVGEAAALGPAGVPLHPTSGTTALPKLALRPGAAAVAEAAHYASAMAITGSDRILCSTPMSHAYAFGMAVMVPLVTGADVLTTPGFNPRVATRTLVSDAVTLFPAVPAMLPVLLRSGWRSAPHLRFLLTAGAPLPADIMSSFTAATRIVPRSLLGTTESGGISVALDNPRPHAVGRAMDGVEVRLASPAGGDEEIGQLEVRSASMMAGYLTPAGIDVGVDAHGWFATGDLASIAADGQIELLGRVTDVINVMGHKVLPSEVEAVIAAIPGVAEVKVYAGRHRGGDDIVQAAIVPARAIDAEAVRRHCAAHLVAFKRPARVHILHALPRTPSGKVVVRDLPSARDASAEAPPGVARRHTR